MASWDHHHTVHTATKVPLFQSRNRFFELIYEILTLPQLYHCTVQLMPVLLHAFAVIFMFAQPGQRNLKTFYFLPQFHVDTGVFSILFGILQVPIGEGYCCGIMGPQSHYTHTTTQVPSTSFPILRPFLRDTLCVFDLASTLSLYGSAHAS